MSAYAHSAEAPGFDAPGIVAGERRRALVRRTLAGACAAAVVGVGVWVLASGPGPWHSDHSVVGGPTGAPSGGPSGRPTAPSTGPSGASGLPGPSGTGATGATGAPGGSGGSSAPAATVPSWPTSPTSNAFAGSVPPVPELVAIGVGQHPAQGYESITFEFTGQLPGYTAKYVPTVVREGSGQTVALPGSAYLQLSFNSAQAHDASGGSTLKNPVLTNPVLTDPAVNPVAVGFPELRSYVMNGDFEGTVSVALGLDAKDGYHIGVLTKSPTDHVIYVNVALPAGQSGEQSVRQQ